MPGIRLVCHETCMWQHFKEHHVMYLISDDVVVWLYCTDGCACDGRVKGLVCMR